MNTPNYTFLPWVRYGLGNFISREDDLTDLSVERSKIDVELKLKDDSEVLNQEVLLGGPGDVIGIQPHAMIKTVPAVNTNQFDPNALPFIEFQDEDFPWRYTAATPNAAEPERLRPWLMLVVLKEDEFTWLGESRPLPSIEITKPVFDFTPEESWAWAHTQVNAELAETDSEGNSITIEKALEDVLNKDKDLALSRVICPRKLEPEQQYYAFLIPSFEAGRLAGIGEDFSSTPIQQASWTIGNTGVSYPFYHHFGFATGENINFETLARKLAPNALSTDDLPKINVADIFEELGTNTSIDFPNYTHQILQKKSTIQSDFTTETSATHITNTHTTIEGNLELPIEAALMGAGFEPEWFGDDNATDAVTRKALLNQINEADSLTTTGTGSPTEDPIVNIPPMYGRWHATENKLPPLSGKLENESWLTQLNLDPSYRIAAGIGADIIRDKQDLFMQQAWDQIGEIREANRQLRQAELNKELGQTLYKKHISKRDEQAILGMTHRLHGKVVLDPNVDQETIQQKVTTSTLPNASLDPAFTKLIRKGGPIAKRLYKQFGLSQELQNGITGKLADNATSSPNSDLVAAGERKSDESVMIEAKMLHSLETKVNSLNTDYSTESKDNVTQLEIKIRDQETNTTQRLATKSDFSIGQFTQSKSQLKNDIEPITAIPKQALSNIGIPSGMGTIRKPEQSAPKTIMAHPEFDQATASYLVEKYPDFFAPAMGQMKDNSVSLMKVNQNFIESYLVGMNHAMGNELLWREFPTDQRGNYFKNFWDTSAYINPLMIPANPEDITPITSWNNSSQLGSHGTTGMEQSDRVILLLKGELFLQYPDMPIFAQKAEWHNGEYRKLADPSIPGNVLFPLLKAPLKENLLALGFNLTVNQVEGDLLPNGDPDPNGDAGWFFIFKEREGELLFGLDESNNSSSPVLARRLTLLTCIGDKL